MLYVLSYGLNGTANLPPQAHTACRGCNFSTIIPGQPSRAATTCRANPYHVTNRAIPEVPSRSRGAHRAPLTATGHWCSGIKSKVIIREISATCFTRDWIKQKLRWSKWFRSVCSLRYKGGDFCVVQMSRVTSFVWIWEFYMTYERAIGGYVKKVDRMLTQSSRNVIDRVREQVSSYGRRGHPADR